LLFSGIRNTSFTPESFLYHNKYQRLRQLAWRLSQKAEEIEGENKRERSLKHY
jgi:hypothetical protein